MNARTELVMRAMAHAGTDSAQVMDWARILGLPRKSMARQFAVLVSAGYVECIPGNDGGTRRTFYTLSRKGKKVAAK